jgi:hypothetical protein
MSANFLTIILLQYFLFCLYIYLLHWIFPANTNTDKNRFKYKYSILRHMIFRKSTCRFIEGANCH